MKAVSSISEIIERGVENIYPSREFLQDRLASGDKLRVYLGIDPTGPLLHLGHSVQLLKLRQFQELGHKVTLLIGDFTATVGDPSGKKSARKKLSMEEVLKNASQYKKQASKILDFEVKNKAEIRHNSEWLEKLNFSEVLELASKVTFSQTIKRDMFQKRMKEGGELYLHEFLYPIMQGYDSVALDVDGEIGGNDQMFNMLVGRDLMKKISGKEKFVLTTKLLTDTGGTKMGKTEGNMITLDKSPDEMYGQVMKMPDELILPGLELLTRMPMAEIKQIKKEIALGKNPRDAKMKLGMEIVSLYHGEKKAREAEENFIGIFQKKEVPRAVLEIKAKEGDLLIDILLKNKIIASKSAFRRLVSEGGFYVNNNRAEESDLRLEGEMLIKIGKHRFVKIVAKQKN